MLTQHPTGSSPSSLSATPHSRTSALQALQAPNERQPNQLPHTAGELSVLLPARAPCGPARELCWGQVNLTFPLTAQSGIALLEPITYPAQINCYCVPCIFFVALNTREPYRAIEDGLNSLQYLGTLHTGACNSLNG